MQVVLVVELLPFAAAVTTDQHVRGAAGCVILHLLHHHAGAGLWLPLGICYHDRRVCVQPCDKDTVGQGLSSIAKRLD
jgi:hypothetical protein